MNLVGNKVTLRALQIEDMKIFNDMINDSEIEKMVVGWSKPVTIDEQEKWFNNLNSDSNIRYAIAVNDYAIGSATIRNIDWKNRSASFDIKILLEHGGQGYGKESIKLLLDYCFNQLNLNRISVNILEFNEISQKLFRSCGFQQEGVQREAVFKEGKYNSLLIFSILRDEYIKIK